MVSTESEGQSVKRVEVAQPSLKWAKKINAENKTATFARPALMAA